MASLMLYNPTKKRRKSAKRRKSTKRRNPVSLASVNPKRRRTAKRATSSRRRSNRGGGKMTLKKLVNNAFVPAAIGGAGALALDVAWGALPIPTQVKTGTIAPFAKLAGAVALGFGARALAGKDIGDRVLVGAVTVGAYGFLKNFLQRTMPNIPLGEIPDYETLQYINAAQFQPDPLLTGGHIPDYEMRQSAGMSEYDDMSAYVGEYVS